MDERSRSSLLKKFVLKLLDPSTTPENVLQSLSSPWFSPTNFNSDDDEPVVIFLACVRFMMRKLPEACVEGIWEDILRKTLKYSCSFYCPHSLLTALKEFASAACFVYAPELCITSIPIENPRVGTWLDKALSSLSKCPNPYSRLELFRLIVQFRVELCATSWERLCNTFVHTICEIQPLNLYQSGDEDDVVFHALDLSCIIAACHRGGRLQQIISSDLIEQFNQRNEVIVDSNETRFLSHCIQIIGIFATMAGSNPDPTIQFIEMSYCFYLFKKSIGRLVNCGNHLPGMSSWKQFCYVIVRPPFNHFTFETIRDLTTAITNCKRKDAVEPMMSLRDDIFKDLDVCNHNCELPGLLLSRPVDGPMIVHQHSLLLRGLARNQENTNEDSQVEGPMLNRRHSLIHRGVARDIKEELLDPDDDPGVALWIL